jgi:hypothetical protein
MPARAGNERPITEFILYRYVQALRAFGDVGTAVAAALALDSTPLLYIDGVPYTVIAGALRQEWWLGGYVGN